MIREGGIATTVDNQLDSTQFSQITEQMRLMVRARLSQQTTLSATQTYRFRVGAIVLSVGVLNSASAISGANTGPADFQGLSDDHIIFNGLVNPGTLQLDFAGTTNAATGVIWDVTAY